MSYDYRCTIVNWIDGDTVKVAIDLGFHITLHETVRIYGINCAEKRSPDPLEREQAKLARDYAEALCPPGSQVLIQTRKAHEKYGRWLATITLTDGRAFAQAMIEAGLAQAYLL